MVAGGVGATLLPAVAAAHVRRAHPHVVLVPFDAKGPGRTIGVAWRTTSARAQEFTLLGELLAASRS